MVRDKKTPKYSDIIHEVTIEVKKIMMLNRVQMLCVRRDKHKLKHMFTLFVFAEGERFLFKEHI